MNEQKSICHNCPISVVTFLDTSLPLLDPNSLLSFPLPPSPTLSPHHLSLYSRGDA